MTYTNIPDIDRQIYPMPMFATLTVSDLAKASALYARAGFVELATVPDVDGNTCLIHLRRQRYQDLFLVKGMTRAGSTVVSFAAGAADLEALRWLMRRNCFTPDALPAADTMTALESS